MADIERARDRGNMELALEQARQCNSSPGNPWVGAVAALNGQRLGTGYRGEINPGDHAEFTLLERKLQACSLAGATVYTTLEPCTERNKPKIPCVDHLIDRKVGRVVIGMLDPNPLISGRGVRKLRQANIVTDLFPPDLMAQLEELNRAFIRSIEGDPVFQATTEIARLARRSLGPIQRETIRISVNSSLATLQSVSQEPIIIGRGLPGYLARFVELIDDAVGTEHVQAFIRLTSYSARGLCDKPLDEDFYAQAEMRARSGKALIDYMFLLNKKSQIREITSYLDQIRRIAARISFVYHDDSRTEPDLVGENIVLFRKQQIAFTHNRDENCTFTGATEWRSREIYRQLEERYKAIETISTVNTETPLRGQAIAQIGIKRN